ncbi:MAG: hypothetical protein ACK4KV_09630 [Rhodocyclaceae bacterium]
MASKPLVLASGNVAQLPDGAALAAELDDHISLDAAEEYSGGVWLDWRTGRRVRAAYVAAAGSCEIALVDADTNTTFFGTLLLQVGAGATVAIYNPQWIGLEEPDFSAAGTYIILFRGIKVGGANHIIADAGRYL